MKRSLATNQQRESRGPHNHIGPGPTNGTRQYGSNPSYIRKI